MRKPSDLRHKNPELSTGKLLTFNAGSSSNKFGVFSLATGAPERIGKGAIDFQRNSLTFKLGDAAKSEITLPLNSEAYPDQIVEAVFIILASSFEISDIAAVGHRMVRGGDLFHGAVTIDDATRIN